MNPELLGQWVGSFDGNPSGHVVLSIDHDRPSSAFATLVQRCPNGSENPPFLRARFDFAIQTDGDTFTASCTKIRHYDNESRCLVDARGSLIGGLQFPSSVSAQGYFDGSSLEGQWSGDHGLINRQLRLTQASTSPSRIAGKTVGWREFRSATQSMQQRQLELLFRGQGTSSHRLRTSLHRVGRYDLERYFSECVIPLATNGRLKESDEGPVPQTQEEQLCLGQHHGLPTPLLDWTRNPLVAAYFAITSAPPENTGFVRVYCFDASAWKAMTYQVGKECLTDPFPSLTIQSCIAEGNTRAKAQQSVHLFSNIDDIETYIDLAESIHERPFLMAFDIPLSERPTALADLAANHISADRLFPDSLEAVCRAAKEQWLYGAYSG